MRMRKPRKSRPVKGGSDQSLAATDRDEPYREARPSTSVRLVYCEPKWKRLLERHSEHPTRPHVRWKGNVAFVAWKPMGLRLVETAPDQWQIGWWMPARHKANRLELFTDAGTRQQAIELLKCMLSERARPVYPPISFEGGAA